MRIIVLTREYPCKYNGKTTTPVVHYFAKEWVKMGHQVKVFHFKPNIPKFLILLRVILGSRLEKLKGRAIQEHYYKEYTEVLDGVDIHHFPLSHNLLYKPISKKQIKRAIDVVMKDISYNGSPNVVTAHWDDPNLMILYGLKTLMPNLKTSLVFHAIRADLRKVYGDNFYPALKSLDRIGFRNEPARKHFENKYHISGNSFVALSGVSPLFIKNAMPKKFLQPINNFIFVGSLIKRKCPKEIVTALSNVYKKHDFNITFVGDGNEKTSIINEGKRMNTLSNICFTGRIPRERIIEHLRNSEIFVMISKNETFGLVYLEAMAMGCITIASVGCGVDGIIKHGENGFLCEPGNTKMLTELIDSITKMPIDNLKEISFNAYKTAIELSDIRVAQNYFENIIFDA